MTLNAFTGSAGVGKTFELMRAQGDALAKSQLADGARVLALTFMHGSRRRLDEKLRLVNGLRGRYNCMTIDRFAWELCVRWRSLRRARGLSELSEDQYDATCDAAGALLEIDDIRRWVCHAYPHVVVDEAQDLTPQRLRILRALEPMVDMLVAADEFQCLSSQLRPNPAMQWLAGRCQPTLLQVQRRTGHAELLAAANAVRTGESLAAGRNLVIRAAPGRAPFHQAAAVVANAIAWNGGREIAVITPSKAGGFAAGVVDRVRAGPVGQQQNGPYDIRWELSDDEAASQSASNLNLPEDGGLAATIEALQAAGDHPAVSMCRNWIFRTNKLSGQAFFPAAVVQEQLARCFTRHRRFLRSDHSRLKAMTAHQAKNREFEGVVILWPYTVVGDAEQQRRLLYNAITRAQRWCTIVAQNANMLQRPPFAAAPRA